MSVPLCDNVGASSSREAPCLCRVFVPRSSDPALQLDRLAMGLEQDRSLQEVLSGVAALQRSRVTGLIQELRGGGLDYATGHRYQLTVI
jgi:hypothetical protein